MGRPLAQYWATFSPCAPQTVMSKKLALSSHSPLLPFLRRVLTARRRLQTEVPDGVVRSSGSRVRLPVRMTRLMLLAAIRRSLLAIGGSSWVCLARVQTQSAPFSVFPPGLSGGWQLFYSV